MTLQRRSLDRAALRSLRPWAWERAFADPGHVLLPTLRLDGDSASGWRLREDTSRPPDFRALDRPFDLPGFLLLADASAADVLRFAKKWGRLHVCPHGVVGFSHEQAPPECTWRRDPRTADTDSVAGWQLLARQAKAALEIAAALRDGHPGPQTSWALLADYPWRLFVMRAPGEPGETGKSVEVDRQVHQLLVSEWLNWARVRPTLRWRDGAAEVELWSFGLRGILARELLFACAGRQGLAACSGCGGLFFATRAPVRGRRSWCPACRQQGRPVTQAKRDQRERDRMGQRDRKARS